LPGQGISREYSPLRGFSLVGRGFELLAFIAFAAGNWQRIYPLQKGWRRELSGD